MPPRRGGFASPLAPPSHLLEQSPFNPANMGQDGAKRIGRGLFQPEHMGYVQTPIVKHEGGEVTGGHTFAIRRECEHWADDMQAMDCRFACELQKELAAS